MSNRNSSEQGRKLPRIALVFVALCILSPTFAADSEEPSLAWTGTDFSGTDIVFPQVLQGKPTVLVFWATWCPYCQALMPYLGEIQSEYGENKINILTINVFEDGEMDPAAYVEELGFPMITVANGEPIAEMYSVFGTPGLMILDGDGNRVWKRESTDLPAGKKVAEFWAGQIRTQLDLLL
jgi:thiol-disulfide isomerase/thioredoxin